MATEATHGDNHTSGFRDVFVAGQCRRGIPEMSQKTQWTWVLNGVRVGCVSNEYKSQATLDFESDAYEEATTHTEAPLVSLTKTSVIRVGIGWNSSRRDGKIKWVLSAACVRPDAGLNFTYEDVLTILDSPGGNMAKTSEGVFQLEPKCTLPNALFIRLARHGEDKDDTLRATVHVASLFLNSD